MPIRAQALGTQADVFHGLTVPLCVAASLLGISTYNLNQRIDAGVFTVEQHDGSQYRLIALTHVLAVRRGMLSGSVAR